MNTTEPRKRIRKRKCKHCGHLYMPDARHIRDQKYCSAEACRMASKRASQQRWLDSPKGVAYRDLGGDTDRVRQWRASHGGYWRRGGRKPRDTLQDSKNLQSSDQQQVTAELAQDALRDPYLSQPALIVGVIASLTGSTLQDTMAQSIRRFVLLGQDILGMVPGSPPKGDNRYAHAQAPSLSRSSSSDSQVVQLD